MNFRLIGAGVLAGALAISALNSYVVPGFLSGFIPKPTTQVVGFSGGEKLGFLADSQVQNTLAGDSGLSVEARKAGSVEMVTDRAIYGQDVDFLWPGNAMQARQAKDRGIPVAADQTIFSSPIVIYSWSNIAEAFVDQGLARPTSTGATGTYFVDTEKLMLLVADEVEWRDVGVQLPRALALKSTDPQQSNSGNQFAALLFSVAETSERCRLSQDQERCAQGIVSRIYGARGFLSGSSGDSFDTYIASLPAANPMIAGYESQIIGWALENPDKWRLLSRSEVRPVVFYPTPTVLSDHPLLALNEDGKKLIDALLSPRLQQRAWEQHGFRSSATLGGRIDPDAVPVPDIPSSLNDIVDMPTFAAVERLTAAIARARGDTR